MVHILIFNQNIEVSMDLYFGDVDLYVAVDPADFEDIVLADAESTIGELITAANELDAIGISTAGVDRILYKISAEYHGRTVTLNRPFRTPNGPKKFSVYVKNDKGNVVKVNFGDPDMKIKRNIPARRKSFRARHHCESPGPKWKARYWSCRMW